MKNQHSFIHGSTYNRLLVDAASKTEDFDEALASLRLLRGSFAGTHAGDFFDEHDRSVWWQMSHADRYALLGDYVSYELNQEKEASDATV